MSEARIVELLSEKANKESAVYISSDVPVTPTAGRYFTTIYALADSVLTLVGNITGATAMPLKAGLSVNGAFTSVTVTSGSVVAYQGGR